MTYTVIWKPPATDRLAEIWMASSDRAAVIAAVNSLDRVLELDARVEILSVVQLRSR